MSDGLRFFGLVIVTSVFLLASQLVLKQGLKVGGPMTLTSIADLGAIIVRVLTSPVLILGYALSGVSALVWLIVLSRFELSYAAPIFTAVYYLMLLLASALVLREQVGPWRWAGAVLVVAGIALITQER